MLIQKVIVVVMSSFSNTILESHSIAKSVCTKAITTTGMHLGFASEGLRCKHVILLEKCTFFIIMFTLYNAQEPLELEGNRVSDIVRGDMWGT